MSKAKRSLAVAAACCLLFAGCNTAASSSVPTSEPSSAQPASSAASTPSSSEFTLPPQHNTSGWEKGYLPQFASPESGTPIVTLNTTMGEIKMMLFPQAAPKAVENFVTHCKDGYYDGLTFHRIMEDFMIQGGDPLGTGAGGKSIWGAPFEDEFSDHLYHFRGAVSMANSGFGTNGSQFFIVQEDAAKYPDSPYRVTADIVDHVMLNFTLKNAIYYKGSMELMAAQASDTSEKELEILVNRLNREINAVSEQPITDELRAKYGAAMQKYVEIGGLPTLDSKHTVFGQVIEGMDIVDKLATVKTDANNRPLVEMKILSTTVEMAP